MYQKTIWRSAKPGNMHHESADFPTNGLKFCEFRLYFLLLPPCAENRDKLASIGFFIENQQLLALITLKTGLFRAQLL